MAWDGGKTPPSHAILSSIHDELSKKANICGIKPPNILTI